MSRTSDDQAILKEQGCQEGESPRQREYDREGPETVAHALYADDISALEKVAGQLGVRRRGFDLRYLPKLPAVLRYVGNEGQVTVELMSRR